MSDPFAGAIKNGAKEIKTRKKSKTNKKQNYFINIPERGEAISYALNNIAQKGDTVVICGKGHETSMAYNSKEYKWSDNEAIKFALEGKLLEISR